MLLAAGYTASMRMCWGRTGLSLVKQMSTHFVKQGSSILCLAEGTKKVLSQLCFFLSLVNSFEVCVWVFFLFKENFLLCLLSNNERSNRFTSCGGLGALSFALNLSNKDTTPIPHIQGYLHHVLH